MRRLFQEAVVTLYSISCGLSLHCNVDLVDNSHWKCAHSIWKTSSQHLWGSCIFTVSFVTVWCNFVVGANRYDTIALMWLNGAADNAKALLEPHHRKSKLHVTHLDAYPQHLGRRCVYLVPLCGQLNEKKTNQGRKIGDTGEIAIMLQ